MSEPKRYDNFQYETKGGEYVRYEDYAHLRSEVEQLMIFCNCTLIPNKLLQAQVERLTKAGDLLAVHYTALSKCVTPNNAKSGSINDWTSVIDWNAAKEGKQSK